MIDISGLPVPDNTPAEGACIRVEYPEAGLAVVILDPPHRSLAVLDLPLMRDLDLTLSELAKRENLRGVVFTGREPLSFAAGADIDAIESLRDPALARRVMEMGQEIFERIAALGRKGVHTVAAVGGPVPGGAFELSLACRTIILADDPKSRIGLPETQLGIVPAWGGCQRLPRRIGVPAALDAILKGRLVVAKVAYKKGLVDRLTPPEYLLRVASDVAMGRTPVKRKSRGVWKWLVDRNPLALAVISRQVQKTIQKQTSGNYPAMKAAVELVAWAPLKKISKGLARESFEGARLGTGDVSKHLVRIFKMMEEAKKLGKNREGLAPSKVEHGAVLGAGVMGGSIASLMADKGIATRLFDISPAGLDAALIEHRSDLAEKLKRKRLQQHEHDAAVDHLDVTAKLVGFSQTQFVIEAVAERIEIKRKVFGDLARLIAPDAILATNTSSLSVTAIAEGIPNPERVVGVHFFNPVKKMPLVEIVRGEKTSDAAISAAAAYAVGLGKTPVVVADVAGFLVNRLLGPYLDEALRLYDNGVNPARIERLAKEFGMPMGPFRLLDEVGLDIAAHAATSLHAAYGDRMAPSKVIEPLLDAGHLGKKTGDGFYVHLAFKPKVSREFSSDFARLARPHSAHEEFLSDEEITDRMMLAMLCEAARCIEEAVVQGPRELDLATIFGMGFPPFRGGLLRWADSLGASEVIRRIEHCASAIESLRTPERRERFTVPLIFKTQAAGGKSFHDA
ncbi:MAG: 3-hydroxyacyl-CoA dehydrogenase/enoyl-CoA hydratase/3-hydroxybutyryl-CoA epimerase [Planctomycetota bacterium]|jgi:3-hydroxyacyl-CoA dehydrogenase/enoyl-CoA hydratase/3-hydroxybutyryl-CoA epimerase